jgi:hypothetical protein
MVLLIERLASTVPSHSLHSSALRVILSQASLLDGFQVIVAHIAFRAPAYAAGDQRDFHTDWALCLPQAGRRLALPMFDILGLTLQGGRLYFLIQGRKQI